MSDRHEVKAGAKVADQSDGVALCPPDTEILQYEHHATLQTIPLGHSALHVTRSIIAEVMPLRKKCDPPLFERAKSTWVSPCSVAG